MFFRTNILADAVRPTNQYRGSIDPIPTPKPHNLGVCTPPLPSCMHHQKSPKFSKNPLFSQKCCFCCFLNVANVVFQNLQNVEMLLPIFIFFIRCLEKSYSTLKSCSERGGRIIFCINFCSDYMKFRLKK